MKKLILVLGKNNFYIFSIIFFILLNYLQLFLLETGNYKEIYYVFFGFFYIVLGFFFFINIFYELFFYIKNKRIALLSFFLICSFFLGNIFFYSEYKFEGGHDQGVYQLFSIDIYNENSLEIKNDFLATYAGYNINNDGNIISGFPPLYSIYLSNFYFLFGFLGFPIANNILLLGFLASLIKLSGLLFNNRKFILYFSVFYLLSFFTLTFSRSGYTENILLFYIWSGIYIFFLAYKRNSLNLFILGLLVYIGIISIRYEFFMYIFGYLLAFSVYIFFFKNISFKFNKKIYLYSLFIIFIFYSGLYYYINVNLDKILYVINRITLVTTSGASVTTKSTGYNQMLFTIIYILQGFGISLLLLYFILSLNFIKKYKKELLIIALLILPQILFIFFPGIAYYYPWFLRRYWSGLLVFIIFLFSLYISSGFIKGTFNKFIIYLLVVLNLSYSISIFFQKEGEGLLKLTKEISEISKNQNDVFIYTGRYSIENFGMILGEAFEKKVITERLPKLKDEKYYGFLLNKYKGNDIYLLSVTKNIDNIKKLLKVNNIKLIKVKEFNLSHYGVFCNLRVLIVNPEKFSSYSDIQKYCNFYDYKLKNFKGKIYIYKFKNKGNLDNSLKKLTPQDRKFIRF